MPLLISVGGSNAKAAAPQITAATLEKAKDLLGVQVNESCNESSFMKQRKLI